jgi:hypothetical protein
VGGGSGGRGSSHGTKRGWGHGNSESDHDSNGLSPPGPGKVGHDQCHKCGKKVHWARDCRSKPKKEATYIAQEEESLMLVTTTPRIECDRTISE